MIRNNQNMASCDTTFSGQCNCTPIPEPVIPPIVPIVSVRSVDGMTGDVQLKKLTIGPKVYDGSADVDIKPVDFGFENAVNYKGWTTSDKILVTVVAAGDLFYASDKLEFWLATAAGEGAGVFRTIPTVDFLAPYAFIKESASQIELKFTDEESYKFFAVLKDKNGNSIFTSNELDLPIEQLIKEIKYDHSTRSLIFILQSGRIVSVSLMELVNSLQEKITPKNKLAFDLVAGLTDFRIETEGIEAGLKADLAAEIIRSTTEDARLETAIKTEESARIEAITTEATTRADADTAEKNARTLEDEKLAGNIAINKTNIETEKTRAQAAEQELSTNLADEITDRKTIDADHKALIDSHTGKFKTLDETTIPAINNAISAESIARLNKDSELAAAIGTEATTRASEDSNIRVEFAAADSKLKIGYEAADTAIRTDFTQADTALDTKISNEATVREAQDTSIRTEFAAADNQVRDEFAAADAVISNRVRVLETADFGKQISEEAQARIAADNALDARIKKFEDPDLIAKVEDINTKYQAKDAELDNAIKKVASDLVTETARATTSEGNITSALNSEVFRAKEAENELNNKISLEIQDRKAADNTLEGKILTEKAERIEDVDTEATKREAGDAALDSKFTKELASLDTAYKAADTAINLRIDDEITRAKKAEQDVSAEVQTETNRAKSIENQLNTNKLNILPKVDDPTDPGFGWEYHIPYSFDAIPDAEKLNITLKTLTLDNKVTKMNFNKVLPGATATTAGLLSAADKVKINDMATATALNTEITRATSRENQIEGDYIQADIDLSNRIDAIKVPVYSMIKDAISGEYAAVYHLTKDGINEGVEINIPKDQMLKDVKTGVCVVENVPEGFHVGEHYIELTFETAAGEKKTYIKVEDVVKPYAGSSTINISSDNIISVNQAGLTRIDTEERARADMDNALANIITTETTRATKEETLLNEKVTALRTDLTAETNRATLAEQTLTNNLATEQQERIKAVSDEQARAEAAELAEETRAKTEEAKKVAIVTTLNSGAKSYVSNTVGDDGAVLKLESTTNHSAVAVNDGGELGIGAQIYDWSIEDSTFKAGTIIDVRQSGIYYYNGNYQPATARDLPENELAVKKDVSLEKARAEATEATLSTNLQTETTRAMDAEYALERNLDSEITRATAAEAKEVTDRNNAITNAINALDVATIQVESQKILDWIKEDDGKISIGTRALTTSEVINLDNNLATLQSNIDAEAVARQQAIEALDSTVSIPTQKVISSIVETNGIVTATTRDLTISEVIDLQNQLTALSNRIKYFEDLNLSFTDVTIGE